jgi:hypothetical protein
MTARTFAPPWAALHAIVAAFAAAAVVDRIPMRTSSAAAWQRLSARLAFGALLIQIAVGGLLRHQLIALPWHLLFAGIAALLVLVAAVPTVQASTSLAAEKRIARRAISSVLVQVSLGAAMFMMILMGTENAPAWLGLTVAHVVMGSVTLVAALALARAHRTASDTA